MANPLPVAKVHAVLDAVIGYAEGSAGADGFDKAVAAIHSAASPEPGYVRIDIPREEAEAVHRKLQHEALGYSDDGHRTLEFVQRLDRAIAADSSVPGREPAGGRESSPPRTERIERIEGLLGRRQI